VNSNLRASCFQQHWGRISRAFAPACVNHIYCSQRRCKLRTAAHASSCSCSSLLSLYRNFSSVTATRCFVCLRVRLCIMIELLLCIYMYFIKLRRLHRIISTLNARRMPGALLSLLKNRNTSNVIRNTRNQHLCQYHNRHDDSYAGYKSHRKNWNQNQNQKSSQH
jgi:hypothetical protein